MLDAVVLLDDAMTVVEASIELAAVAWAKERDILTRKLQWIGRRNAPDRLFVRQGRAVFIEFKRPGARVRKRGNRADGPARATQNLEIARMREAGLEVHVVSDLAQFIRIMEGPTDDRPRRRIL